MASAAAILVDWGTTNFRAWLVSPDGTVVDRRQAPCGIMQVKSPDFPAALAEQVGDWRKVHAGIPVLMAGMVGSRQGWLEAPYVACPAGIADLAGAVVALPDAPGVRVVPGLSCRPDGERHDVMRGEEVQIFGAIDAHDASRQVLCLPGTHSKWAIVENGRVTWFATAMTGEIFSVLAQHSILGRLMTEGPSDGDASFRAGCDLSETAGGLLHHLFAVRANGLFGTIPANELRLYLAGILVGHEIRSMLPVVAPGGPVTVVARPDVARLYETAVGLAGHDARVVEAEAASLRGLTRIMEAGPHD